MRTAFTRAGAVASMLAALAVVLVGLVGTATAEQSGPNKPRLSGPLANATVSFGAWKTDPPLDRFPNVSPRIPNQHDILPQRIRVRAGGAVNFVIGGLHEPIVYKDTQPGAINSSLTTPSTGTPAGVPLINDPANRVYRGLDPSLQPQDRVEVVHFGKPGNYLVICGVQPHFVNDGMYAFIRVTGEDED
jgi:hypothetical protein